MQATQSTRLSAATRVDGAAQRDVWCPIVCVHWGHRTRCRWHHEAVVELAMQLGQLALWHAFLSLLAAFKSLGHPALSRLSSDKDESFRFAFFVSVAVCSAGSAAPAWRETAPTSSTDVGLIERDRSTFGTSTLMKCGCWYLMRCSSRSQR